MTAACPLQTKIVAGLTIFLATQPACASAADCSVPTPIRFKAGATSASVTGTVLRAKYACYTVSARAGQLIKANVTSPEQNVVFIAYRPGFQIKQEADGPDVTGPTLDHAGEQDEATNLSSIVPRSGTTLFLLGTTRGGGGTYTFAIKIKSAATL